MPVKVAHRDGKVVHATPEFEDVAALADELDRPVQSVLSSAVAAAEHAGLTSGGDVPVGLRATPTGEPEASDRPGRASTMTAARPARISGVVASPRNVRA